MVRTVSIAGGALTLLLLVLLARGGRNKPQYALSGEVGSAVSLPSAPEGKELKPERGVSPPPAGTQPAVEIFERLASLASRVQSIVKSHQDGKVPYAQEELADLMCLERDVQGLIQELVRSLRQNPSDGHAVLDRLVALEDECTSLRLAGAIAAAFDEPVRERLARALREGASLRERLLACRILTVDPGPLSLQALLHAAQRDADPDGRLAALEALDARRHRGYPNEAPLIRHAAATVSATDPDHGVRARAVPVASPPAAGGGFSAGRVGR